MRDHLKRISPKEFKTYLAEREGETKLGQAIQLLDKQKISDSDARFVLLGIPEDIGVRANGGKAGTSGFWPEFLKVFLNIQSNQFLDGKEILLAGAVDCFGHMQQANNLGPSEWPEILRMLDQEVQSVLSEIFSAGKIPIVIGGGHNNAYPIIKAAHNAFNERLNIVNIDPHADMRAIGKRHSGNGFSYAMDEGKLEFYLQVGLHESYNNQHILNLYEQKTFEMAFFSYDDFLKEKWSMEQLRTYLREHFANKLTGFELDTDSIEHFPSSAQTPSGFSTAQARQLTMMVTEMTKPIYFHLPEAIPATTPFNSMKMAAYLVSDFIKNHHV